MKTNKLRLRAVAFMGIGAFLACSPGGNMPDAQTNARDHRSDPPVTSAPAEDTDGEDTIDYENAQPVPMPSLPDPPPSDNLPIPPAGGGSLGQPGSAPGSYGTGEQNLKVLFPPKSLPDSPLDDITNVEKRKSR